MRPALDRNAWGCARRALYTSRCVENTAIATSAIDGISTRGPDAVQQVDLRNSGNGQDPTFMANAAFREQTQCSEAHDHPRQLNCQNHEPGDRARRL